MSALSSEVLSTCAPEIRERLERMLSFERPLLPLEDLSRIPTPDGWEQREVHQDENGEWPYEHAPGERRPLDDPSPLALEDVEEEFL